LGPKILKDGNDSGKWVEKGVFQALCQLGEAVSDAFGHSIRSLWWVSVLESLGK